MAAPDALRATFFEECEDLLSRLSEGLDQMAKTGTTPDIETLHAVFRAVHSIKGGAAAFGLTALVEFAHVFETVLDLMRAGALPLSAPAVQTMVRASDVLSDLVAAAQDGGSDPPQMAALFLELDLLAEQGPSADETEDTFDFQPLPILIPESDAIDTPAPPAEAAFVITLAPLAELYAHGHEPGALLRALARLGRAELTADIDAIPPLADLVLSRPHLRWRMRLSTAVPREDIDSVFDFVGEDAEVSVTCLPAELPTLAEKQPRPPQLAPALPLRPVPDLGGTVASLPMSTTIRVDLDRVDRLINQIGELVILEAVLAQAVSNAGLRDDSDLATSLAGIRQLAASIQESVLSIRAQPLKPVFQRMQRIAREACDATGKQVRLVMIGDTTEVDKTVIERLADPLTHMIRNSVDHGIEPPAQRAALGKPPTGVITLSAAHRSGRVIIELSDDGGGIDRARVRAIAETRGLVTPEAVMTPADIDNLLFLPGFSSKEEASALSGRGVGLDVVRREIQSLGGRVTLQSSPCQGTTFTIALPLTLAVLDGMLISVGRETMVLPLSAIVETIRPSSAQIHLLGQTGRLVANRGELVPIIDLAECFGFAPIDDMDRSVLIMVESDSGRRAALAATSIHDQRQVVIKSLEQNYGTVHGIAAATILGDGRIALIIDPEEILRTTAVDPPAPFPSAPRLSAHG
ncbi:MAG: chemotaxis protein CheA [Rhodobacteraceae bacterium PARR1]|nr:MAG: chemotaxis protein CheA [Rhodobacteraceae bacterium PARR1]